MMWEMGDPRTVNSAFVALLIKMACNNGFDYVKSFTCVIWFQFST